MVVNFPPTTPGQPGYSLTHTEPSGVTWEYDGEKWRVTGGSGGSGGGGSSYGDDDVDLHLNTASAGNNQVLSWTGTDYGWVNQSVGGGGGDLNKSDADTYYLSKTGPDTAAGEITFEGQTTHEAGIKLGSDQRITVPDNNSSIRIQTSGLINLYSELDSSEATLRGTQCSVSGVDGDFTQAVTVHMARLADVLSFNSTDEQANIYLYSTLVPDAQNTSGDLIGYRGSLSTTDNTGTGGVYNFYAGGNAPNYFKGNMEFDCPTVYTSTALNHKTKFLSSCVFKSATGTGSNSGQGAFEVMAVNTGGSSNNAFVFTDTTGVNKAVMRGSIKISSSGTNYNETSDYRLKSNILPLSSATNLVKQLNPVSFDINGVNRRGFIAHELQVVEPLAVDGVKDETEIVGTYTGTDGVTQTDVPEPEAIPYGATWEQTGTRDIYQGVDQSKLIPILTKALQEVIAKNEDLEARLAVLEGN